jgi:hypothetical protein
LPRSSRGACSQQEAHEQKLKKLERELMEIKDEKIDQDRGDIEAQEKEVLVLVRERRRIAKEKLDARREHNRQEMGLAGQDELLKRGAMVPAHLPLAASASLKELLDGAPHARGEQRKSFVEFSDDTIQGLETNIEMAEQRSADQIQKREQQRRRVIEQKELRCAPRLRIPRRSTAPPHHTRVRPAAT